MGAPPKPARLSLWMAENGRPNQLRVAYRQTGTDTADTWIVFTVTDFGKKGASIEARPGDFGRDRWGSEDVALIIDHAFCLDWTEGGRKLLEEWQAFVKKEARDLAEFERLKKKFA